MFSVLTIYLSLTSITSYYELLSSRNLQLLKDRYEKSQNPPDCQNARYMIIDTFHRKSGLGFSYLGANAFLLQCLVEGRVLIMSSVLENGPNWDWCGKNSKNHNCYFEPWSRCESEMYSINTTQMQVWRGASTMNTQFVYVPQRMDPTRKYLTQVMMKWEVGLFNKNIAPLGRIAWWNLGFHHILKLREYVVKEAQRFLEHHLIENSRFIVCIARHGDKASEEKVVQVEEYINTLKTVTQCVNTKNILIVSESQTVVDEFHVQCRKTGWNCFWTNQRRTNRDAWTKTNTDATIMDHIGWHSVLNLAISQYGSFLICSIQSAWSKITLAFMNQISKEGVQVVSLRDDTSRTADFLYPYERKHLYMREPICQKECVVVTAWFGENHHFDEKIGLSNKKCDFIAYTDSDRFSKAAKVNGWSVIRTSFNSTTDKTVSVMDAKIYKMQPHRLPDIADKYKIVVWVDSKMSQIDNERIDELLKESNAGILLHQNFCCGGEKNDVMDEFKVSLEQSRYVLQKEKMITFISNMISMGFDQISSRFSNNGIIIFRINRPEVKEILNTWYRIVKKTGIYQDQISWHFVQQMYGDLIYVYSGKWPSTRVVADDAPNF